MSTRMLIIEGAKQNNLKNIGLELPHDQVIAVTGVSGSGKSSLAFDTLFAEGQWRFIESLSTYARLFLEKLDRPDVDAIRNIRPAIALEQRNPVRGSRSTVGTLTEIYDYLRVLYSKAATPFCPHCGGEITKWDPSAVALELVENHNGGRAVVLFETGRPLDELMRDGFHRAWRGGEITELDAAPVPAAGAGGGGGKLDIVLDRLVIKEGSRLSDSVETAWRHGNGSMKVVLIGGPELAFSAKNTCDECGLELEEPTPILFSFNHPVGACPECKGFGNVLEYSEDLIVPRPELSLAEGAVGPLSKPAAAWWKRQLMDGAKKAGINIKKPYSKLSDKEKEWIFKGDASTYGVDEFFEDLERKRYKLHVRVFLSRYRRALTCPECGGKRLRKEALAYKVGGLDISALTDMTIGELVEFFRDAPLSPFERSVVGEPLRQIGLKLGFLSTVGLDYLGLSREGKTLSGGEYQRVNLSKQLASRLTGTLYVLDEPTVGLHARDTERVTRIMNELAGLGNTLVVVEHDRSVIENAGWVVELGPGGGRKGGNVVFSGPAEDFIKADTLTARYVRGLDATAPKKKRRKGFGKLVLKGAKGNNLKNVELSVPLGTFSTVTGVSGSGKSTLVVETLHRALAKKMGVSHDIPLPFDSIEGTKRIKSVKLIDQSPIGKTPRSNPVTYLKIFDQIRKLFAQEPEARAHGYGPGFFSFNVRGGRCETCGGEGWQKVEMYFFEDLFIRCEDCGGKRYGPEALAVHYRGKDISDVLGLTVDEAYTFFSDVPQVRDKFSTMREIGLGYLGLGQPATTLSGGEAQRLKICSELGTNAKGGVLYILDEPTVGLHATDVGVLLGVLERLVEAGNTVLVIEHNMDVIKASDWVIDLGPEGGDKGGKVVFSGTPEGLMKKRNSYTGKYLKAYLNGKGG